jgi:hypothetical protein
MITYAKNPAELAILTNPQKPTKTMKRRTTRRSTRSRRNPAVIKRTKDLLLPAAGILGGMVAATQVTRLASGFIPAGMQKIGSVAIPLAAGVALTGMGKSSLVKFIGIGAGAAGVAAGARMAMPSLSFLPMSGAMNDALSAAPGFVPDRVRLSLPTMQAVPTFDPGLDDSQFVDDSGWLDENDLVEDAFVF